MAATDNADSMDFAAFRRLLGSMQASWEPAEAHGAFCGRACLRGAAALQDWLAELAASATDNALAVEAGRTLQTAAADSLVKLEAGQLAFQLLLPDDDAPLRERAAALADWCHGFMQGLAIAGGADQGKAADTLAGEDIAEILEDFSAITNAGAEGEADEAGENAYAELQEYVRVSVQLIYDATAALRTAAASPDRERPPR